MNINVDTLALAIQLEKGGFTTEQARALASALGQAAQVADLVTNADMTAALAQLESRITIKLGSMLIIVTGIIMAAIRYLH